MAAAAPVLCLAPHIPEPPAGRTVVGGAGKAGGSMAAAFEKLWRGGPLSGLVVTRYGHACPTRAIEVVEAAHPVPDAAGQRAAQRMLELVRGLSADDLLVCLISGGGSALLALPAPGIGFEQKREINRQLLLCGADITEINCVRKHLSAIKGGRLAAAAAPARVIALVISDVVGNDPATIASGPTVGDPTTLAMAREVIARYGVVCPPEVTAHLADPASETPKPGDPRLLRGEYRLIASRWRPWRRRRKTPPRPITRCAIWATASPDSPTSRRANRREWPSTPRRRGKKSASFPAAKPRCRCAATGAADATANSCWLWRSKPGARPATTRSPATPTGHRRAPSSNAGAWLAPEHWNRAAALGIDAAAKLADNDSYGFFSALDALVVTGPTLTNVNDFRAILVDPEQA
jgi:hydroxypyruvate reductase